MTLQEIKSTPRYELEGLLYALRTYDAMHAYDGYNDKDIRQMAKEKPEVRAAYNKSLNTKRKYERLAGLVKPEKRDKSFKDLLI